MRILSLGLREIDLSRFKPVEKTILNKPDFGSGCLWGSTEIKLKSGAVTSSWKTFLDDSSISKDGDFGLSFTLHKNSKVLEIDSFEEYVYAMREYKKEEGIGRGYCKYQLDFSKISRDYDAFHLTEDAFYELRLPLYELNDPVYKYRMDNFYSYDAETWIIFNPRCINLGSILTRNNIKPIYDEEF